MNRRGFMATSGAFAGLGLLPSWRIFKQRKQIDLKPFCREAGHYGYAIDKPFAQDGMVYATDGYILCRTTLADVPELGEGVKLPGASTLPWWQGESKWRPWPKLNLFSDGDAYRDTCPMCDGKGVFGNVRECQACEGCGYINVWGCRTCCERGYLGDVRCDYCAGRGSTRRPALQRVGRLVVAGHYDAKIRRLGDVEYCITGDIETPVKFRGDGFEGLLMPLIDRG